MADREPCPWAFVEDMAVGWALGAFVSWPYHFNVLRPYLQSRTPELMAARLRRDACFKAHNTGMAFAMWGGAFSMWRCILVYARDKEDQLSSIVAGGLTAALSAEGVRAVRIGMNRMDRRNMWRGFKVGAFLLASIELLLYYSTEARPPAMVLVEPTPGYHQAKLEAALKDLDKVSAAGPKR